MHIVYSRSPHSMEYYESGLLPQLEHRAMMLNWSDRAKWPKLDLRVLTFRAFAGETSFNPIVTHFKPFRWPRDYRFSMLFETVSMARNNRYTSWKRSWPNG
ncbi:MAG: hypothetical protein IT424_13460 [Pirellulales bacterium]|nr:hypothetical protein [Pirellulales bacterium]